ncbi:PEBP-like protein [Colletotrichum falcatum]|nr:PEBP-like protein [Colletotrichum falcatum]
MTDVTTIFEEHNVIPDVLPAGTKIPYNLGVHWPTVSLRAPAERLHRDQVQEQPKVTTNFKPDGASGDEYVLLMVDPDLSRYNDGTFGQVRHWLVANATLNDAGDVILDDEDDDDDDDDDGSGAVAVSPYVGPAPLDARLVGAGARPSRYIFLLLRRPGGRTAAMLRGGFAGALGGDAQHVVDRMGFDTRAFVEANGLQVVAATFVFVEGNAKSTLANAALLVSGAAQKAVGS